MRLSNFNSQWTKTLYQNNLKNIAFFLLFFQARKSTLRVEVTFLLCELLCEK